MSDPVIVVENLSKRYSLGHQRRSDGLRHSIEAACRNPLAWWSQSRHKEEFLALKDISFEVNRGEVLGIIGRNGAGKSTLLKILSRITEPTHGRIHLKGKVASLLEVGTGFHPELTGRENIFLNGAILGMTRVEIKKKFDEIVAFADVEKFLDTPVKRYSSGMYVRLAFSIAAHLEPEILIVDEVLAVGDMEFQKKCMGRMNAVAREGHTILFVSHNIAAVRNLCNRGLVLSHGQIVQDCEVNAAVNFYIHNTAASNGEHSEPHVVFNCPDPQTDFAVTQIEILDLSNNPMSVVETGDDFTLRITFRAPRTVTKGAIDLLFFTDRRRLLFSPFHTAGWHLSARHQHRGSSY